MRALPALILCLSTATLPAQSAPRVTTPLPPQEMDALLAVREQVWSHWFSGDTAALRRVLPPELVAISPDSGHWRSLEETLAGSAQFKARGATLDSLRFSETAAHRIGDVVVLFSHYAVYTSKAGAHSVQVGRATEVFVRRGARWVHPSWHLDVTP